ncbi:MAG: hypothetical protein V9E83_10825 [Baekduia sp.]
MTSLTRATLTTTAVILTLLGIGASGAAADSPYQTGAPVGDGFSVIPTATRIYNVNHHDPVNVECRELKDGSRCSGYPFAHPSLAEAALAPHGSIDAQTGKLWVSAQAPGAAQDVGFACVEVGNETKAKPKTCGFVKTGTGALPNDGSLGGSIHSGDDYGRKLYAIDTRGTIHCLDMATGAPCAGQPYDVGLPDSDKAGTHLTRIGDTSKFIARTNPSGLLFGPSSVICFDAATNAVCAGWAGPATIGSGTTTVNGSVISAQTNGAWDSFCGFVSQNIPFANQGDSLTVQCLKLSDGSAETVPPGLAGTALTGGQTGWQYGVAGMAEADTTGTRVYFAMNRFKSTTELDKNDRLVCYDYATKAVCPGYPNDFFGGDASAPMSKTYAVTADSTGCIWTLGDPGIAVHRKADSPTELCYPWSGRPGAPTADNPVTTTNPGDNGATIPQSVGCFQNKLILTDVFPNGKKTRLIGVAPGAAAGQRVTLVSNWNGRTVATPTVNPDLSFSATVALPPKKLRLTNKARYFAKYDSERSKVLKFARRMYTKSITQSGGKLTFKGLVTKPLDRPIRKVILRASASCSTISKGKIVATVKVNKKGEFKATFAPPAGLTTVYMRAETRVRRYAKRKSTNRTFTLIRGVKVGS